MALAKEYALGKMGIDAKIPAYIALRHIVVDSAPKNPADINEGSRWFASALAVVYASREAKFMGAVPLDQVPVKIEFDPTTDNLYAQFYAALKKLPAFAGATDV